jgi:HD-GYP domain-containing protein (c-di-GMP phosphodiesterase class II)
MGANQSCAHANGHSAVGRYSREFGWLRFVLVCDDCDTERGEFDGVPYRPRSKPYLNGLAELTARELGLPDKRVELIRLAALLRDAGMEQLPTSILHKRGPLSDADWIEIRRHPETGAAMLGDARFDEIRAWILSHHERPDGRGYPRGLRGDEIPLEASILAVVDAYEAMTSNRHHRQAISHAEACRELQRCAGTQFDARTVDAFLSAVARRRDRPQRAVAAA